MKNMIDEANRYCEEKVRNRKMEIDKVFDNLIQDVVDRRKEMSSKMDQLSANIEEKFDAVNKIDGEIDSNRTSLKEIISMSQTVSNVKEQLIDLTDQWPWRFLMYEFPESGEETCLGSVVEKPRPYRQPPRAENATTLQETST